jgi:hypothetical protein
VTGCTHFFSLSHFLRYVCLKRPEALAALLARQTDFFERPVLFATPEKEELTKIDSSGGDERVLLVSDVKREVGNDDQKDNIEETRVDQKEEGANNNNEAEDKKEEEEEEQIASDISRKYPVIGTEEKDGEFGEKVLEPPLPPVARKLLLFVVVVVGLVTTWYSRKVQRKRSGWHKKIDATLTLAWFTKRQGRARPGPVGNGKEARRKLVY